MRAGAPSSTAPSLPALSNRGRLSPPIRHSPRPRLSGIRFPLVSHGAAMAARNAPRPCGSALKFRRCWDVPWRLKTLPVFLTAVLPRGPAGYLTCSKNDRLSIAVRHRSVCEHRPAECKVQSDPVRIDFNLQILEAKGRTRETLCRR